MRNLEKQRKNQEMQGGRYPDYFEEKFLLEYKYIYSGQHEQYSHRRQNCFSAITGWRNRTSPLFRSPSLDPSLSLLSKSNTSLTSINRLVLSVSYALYTASLAVNSSASGYLCSTFFHVTHSLSVLLFIVFHWMNISQSIRLFIWVTSSWRVNQIVQLWTFL